MAPKTPSGDPSSAVGTALSLHPSGNLSSQLLPAKLTREKYSIWRAQYELVLERMKVLGVVTGETKRPVPVDEKAITDDERAAIAKWDTADLDARILIMGRIDDEFIVEIQHLKTAAAMWETLSTSCRVQGTLGTIHWIRRMVRMRYDESTDLQAHITALEGCVRELSFIQFKMPDDVTAALLLNSMPDSYEPVAASLPSSNLDLAKVRARLLDEYHRRKGRAADAEAENALYGKSGTPSAGRKYCTYHQSTHHSTEECRDKGEKKGGTKRGKKKKKEGGNKANHAKDDDASEDSTEHSMFLVSERALLAFEATAYAAGDSTAPTLDISPDEDSALVARLAPIPIIVDSGTTSHIHPVRSDFSSLDTSDTSQISGINGKTLATGRGTFHLPAKRPDGSKSRLKLRDALHAPDAHVTLLSVSRMDSAGCRIVFADGKCTITDRRTRQVLATASLRNRLYHLDIVEPSLPDRSHLAQTPSDLELWHYRFSHLGYDSLRKLARKKMVKGLDIADLTSSAACCPGCLAGKMHRSPFPKVASRSSQILELVHSDLWGEALLPSLGGSKYYMSITDDYSRFTYVFTLKQKSDAFSAFKTWLALVETQTGRKLKSIRTDNGGEYVSDEFSRFLSERGIRRQLTAPYNPEQNGVAERLNRTLLERVRACLHAANLSWSFWAEALAVIVHTKNMCPTVALKHKTPYEAWYGKKPDVSHLRIFGSVCYAHVPAPKRPSKFHSRATKAIFVGYPDESKCWKVYVPGERRIIRSRDVVFDERLPSSAPTSQSPQPSEGEIPDIILPGTPQAPDPSHPSAPPAPLDDSQTRNEIDAPPDAPADSPADSPPASPPPPAAPRLRRGSRTRTPHWKVLESAQMAEVDEALARLAVEPEHDGDFIYYVCLSDTPSYSEAMRSPDAPQWMTAMQEEINAIHGLGTFELVPLPPGRKAIGSKWVFRIKRNALGAITRYKARLVAQGFSQIPGIDFGETFAPVARIESLRILFAIAAVLDWEIGHMDVKAAFLNGELKEELFLKQPKGFVVEGKAEYVWKLLKSLYGLKQASRVWYYKFRAALIKLGFSPLLADPCIFVRIVNRCISIIGCHVDDLALFCNTRAVLNELKAELSKEFEMTDLGDIKLIVGLAVTRDRANRTITLSQSHYIEQFGNRFQGDDVYSGKASTPLAPGTQLSKAQSPATDEERAEMKKTPYQVAVGSLMYAAICTRPELSYPVGQVSQFSSNPGPTHWKAVKRIIRYAKNTKDRALTFGGPGATLELTVHCDADYAQETEKRHSTTGFCCKIAGGVVSYASRRQTCVSTSTVEAEYVAACSAAKDAVWIRLFLTEIGMPPQSPTPLFIDNSGSLRLTQDNTLHNRTKHIDVQYHYVRELVEQGVIAPAHVPTDKNISDIFTKALPLDKFSFFVPQLGLTHVEGEC